MSWRCPNCDNVNSDDTLVCDCGYELDENETQKYSHNSGLPKISRKQGCLLTFALFVLTILFLFYKGCTINLPPIEGTVLYEEVNKPVEDAYVICFNYKYRGAWRDPNYVEVVKTKEDGKFTLNPYRTISIRNEDTREFLIYKPGHSVLRYFQANSSQFIDMNRFPWSPKVKAKKVFLIPKDFDNENNNIIYVASGIEHFARHFKYEDTEKHKSNSEMFHEIYRHLMNDSELFLNSKQTNKNARQNWSRPMKNLRYYLDLE